MADDKSALRAEIDSVLRSSGKIEAIRMLRERTGLGLAMAKSVVEAIERGGPDPDDFAWPDLNEADEKRVVDSLANEGKIAAIKLHRQITGFGLAESKQAVEALAVKHQIEAPASGCLGILLLGALFLTSIAMIA